MSIYIAIYVTFCLFYVASGIPDKWARDRDNRAKLFVATVGLATSMAFICAWVVVING